MLCLHREGLSLNIWHVFWKVLRTGSGTRSGGITKENTLASSPRKFVPAGRKSSLFIKGLTLHILLSALCTDAFVLVGKLWKNWQAHPFLSTGEPSYTTAYTGNSSHSNIYWGLVFDNAEN